MKSSPDASTTWRRRLPGFAWLLSLAIIFWLEGILWTGRLLAAVFLFILPGWALTGSLWSGWGGRHWAEKTSLACGVSLAIYPLLFLWTDLVGLHLGSLLAWLPPLVAVIIIAIRNRNAIQQLFNACRNPLRRSLWQTTGAAQPSSDSERKSILKWIPDLTLLVLLILIFAVRFWSIRNLVAPMFGDSYQHTLITQLIVDHGGLFNSWAPYTELESFTYHFGFHTLAAVYYWVTGIPLMQSVLWTGQILNGLAILCIYPLVTRITSHRWAGALALLVAGLLSPMPFYYVNWGRYTQLAGQVILPAAVYISWITLENLPQSFFSFTQRNQTRSAIEENAPARSFKCILLITILFSGLALTHYRVFLFAVFFFAICAAFSLHKGQFLSLVTVCLISGIGAGLLFLPWFVRLYGEKILSLFTQRITTPASQISAYTQLSNAIGDPSLYMPIYLWLILFISIFWGVAKRSKGAILISLWWVLTFLAANPQWFKLPGAGAISTNTVLMALYIPTGVLAGAAASWLVGKISQLRIQINFNSRLAWISSFLFLIAITALGLWGAHQRLHDLRIAENSLVTPPDIRAMTWIENNAPPNARFLVNTFFAFNNKLVVGSDAGWWLPLLAHRQTNLPPINYILEKGPGPNFRAWTNALPALILEKGIGSPEVYRELSERKIQYLYIGQQQGSVNSPGPALDLAQLLASPNFTPIYHQSRVWIFSVK